MEKLDNIATVFAMHTAHYTTNKDDIPKDELVTVI